jgi:hypothetical protein
MPVALQVERRADADDAGADDRDMARAALRRGRGFAHSCSVIFVGA